MQPTKKASRHPIFVRGCKRFLLIALTTTLAAACLQVPWPEPSRAAAADEPKAQSSGAAAGQQAPASQNAAARQETPTVKTEPQAGAPAQASNQTRQAVKLGEFEPYYAEVLKDWQSKGRKAGSQTITIDASKPSNKSATANASAQSYEGKSNVLVWDTSKDNWIEFTVDVPADGLYEMHVSYRPFTGKGYRKPITWDVLLDGKHPFREASSVTLYRQWKDARPIKKDVDGNDIRPKSEDISSWMAAPMRDAAGAYADPLQWLFTKGKHTIRLEGYEPVALESIKLMPKAELKSYADVAKSYPPSGKLTAEAITLQAEEMSAKNDSAIQMVSDTDQRSVPLAKGRITFNTVGGMKWYNQNQEISWTFTVTESGKYRIGVRALQNVISQKSTFRRIAIDGKVPFQEMLGYRFPYSMGWQGVILQDNDGKPYDFYLEKGTHTLSMAVTHYPFKPIIIGIEELTDILREVDQDLKSLTGGVSDKNRTWKIAQDLPDLPPRLEKAAKLMTSLSEQLVQVNGRKDNISQSLLTSASDIQSLLNKVDDIPYHADQITSMQEKVSKFIEQLVQQPLQLDELYIVPADKSFPEMEAGFFTRVVGMVKNFFYSFDSKSRLSDMDDNELNVWVHRGRDYVNLLQELADEMFTPETGIRVKVNLLPNPQLLILSNAAGIQPDIALGLSQDLPVDYAIRGSIYDLSQFKDFDAIYKRYSPGSWLAFYYDKGYYALPETQSFQVLFYRKDIMAKLGLALPDTWEDVYDMLPTLQQNYMNFYVPPKEFIPYFYQSNAEFFEKTGLKTALETPESFKAFKMWTDMFNIYAIDREVPSFYQHFRKGDIPIGVADYNMYVQLSAAAPELNGSWGIAPLPGTKQPDGSVTRWAGGGQTTAVIFKKSNKKDRAWEFLKWWTSADVQERYGSDLEAFNGVSFRWNTANIEAFAKLPWKREDANVILQQWKWYKEMPNLPGSYFIGREMTNAWNRTVVDGLNYRTSLEQAVMDIERELRRKQQEFGFVDADGNPLRTMDLPVVSKPWEGVDDYVK
ncbi:extracellular solute-binding protein [Paenibacillus hamazuiensis]|uniref:extracellular solute-binding protein n=1 Tax=Paenibacillus hamazuiensis TaxID=2936508 RepID=UPI00200BAA9D|nr:extracellular solute-binding protein [Paenibacillus hamazuiensis]